MLKNIMRWPWRVFSARRRRRDLLSVGELSIRLEEERSRAERSSLPLSVILCDLGRVEESFGAARGFEHFLGGLCRWLQGSLRRVDVRGWYDASQVAILLPATPHEGAECVLERLAGWLEAELRQKKCPEVADPRRLLQLATYPDCVRRRAARRVEAGLPSFAGGPSLGGVNRIIKRGLDIGIGSIMLLLSLPAVVLIGMAIRLTSPGPAIYRQVRLGEGGGPFNYYKFRSMHMANDDTGHREYTRRLISGEVETINNGEVGNLCLKLRRDPRVTALGRFLRRSSLDELPQLINVLKGDMSLVGPRPPIPYETEHYRDWHLRRILAAKPGMTGLWQVRSRSSSSFDEMVRLDLCYADSWSIWADLKILFQTIPAVLSAKGAC
ncbi:MAG: sugar transferase [Pseudomonadota bacterium]